MKKRVDAVTIAWLVTAVYYFFQYSLDWPVRDDPSCDPFGLNAMAGIAWPATSTTATRPSASSPASAWMARAAQGRPLGAATVGIGALLFATGNIQAASVGRFLQGAGGVFALVGAAYIATTNFPASRAATLIGATQMFGMAGGSAGQFVVGPMIGAGVSWSVFWLGMGTAGLVISVLLFVLLPPSTPRAA